MTDSRITVEFFYQNNFDIYLNQFMYNGLGETFTPFVIHNDELTDEVKNLHQGKIHFIRTPSGHMNSMCLHLILENVHE